MLTGCTGFKGSWLSLWLQVLGAELVGYSLSPPTQPSLFELAAVDKGMIAIAGDVTNLDQLQQVMQQHQPEIVIHMAAQSLVRESYSHPIETYNTNVMGTVHLLEAVRRVGGVRVVVNVTSDKCYENREWVWGYREDEPMGGYDPYSSSKGCSELVTAAYRNSFFNPANYAEHRVAVATARAGNVIGGGDWAKDRLVPDVMRSLFAGEVPPIRNPQAIRPWQHVLEPLNGYLMLAEALYTSGTTFAEGWNFGPDDLDVQPVSWVVAHLSSLWGKEVGWQAQLTTQLHEANCLRLDCAKAHARLGWRSHLDLKTALAWIVDWSKALQAGDEMRQVTIAQIQQYMELAAR